MASSPQSQAVVDWRRRAKARLVAAFGGGCGMCGYSRCDRNLHFHHLDPAEKEFSFGALPTVGWERLVAEIRKCVMLCGNCHGEIHAGIAAVPVDIARFDEAHAVYREPKPRSPGAGRGSGSPGVPRPKRRKVERPSKRTLERLLVQQRVSRVKIGQRYGVSDVSVAKWARTYGIVARGCSRGR